MDGAFGFLIGILVGMLLLVNYLITPNELKIRLYELGYNTGQQAQIMSGLVR